MFTHVDHGITLPKISRQTTESGRKYFTPDGKAYPSITTVLGVLNLFVKKGLVLTTLNYLYMIIATLFTIGMVSLAG